MSKLGSDLIAPGGRQRSAIDAVPEARALIPMLSNTLDLLVASQPPSESKIRELTSKIRLVDVRHDDLVRGTDGRLEAEYYSTTSQEIREKITRVRAALFATGRAIIQASYVVEAGEVPFRAARVTAADREFLRTMETCEGRTLEQLVDELQALATEIGVIDKERDELGRDGELVVKDRAARFQWIRAINALIGVLVAAGVDPTPIVGPIDEKAAEAERRAAAGGDDDADDGSEDGLDENGNDDNVVATGGTNDTDTDGVLDPPIPTDVVDPTDAGT